MFKRPKSCSLNSRNWKKIIQNLHGWWHKRRKKLLPMQNGWRPLGDWLGEKVTWRTDFYLANQVLLGERHRWFGEQSFTWRMSSGIWRNQIGFREPKLEFANLIFKKKFRTMRKLHFLGLTYELLGLYRRHRSCFIELDHLRVWASVLSRVNTKKCLACSRVGTAQSVTLAYNLTL